MPWHLSARCLWCGVELIPGEEGPLCSFCLSVPVGPPPAYNHEPPAPDGAPAEEE